MGGGAAIAAPTPTGPPGFKPDERQFFPATHGQNTLKLARDQALPVRMADDPRGYIGGTQKMNYLTPIAMQD